MYIEHIRYILGQERRGILDWCDRNGAELFEKGIQALLSYPCARWVCRFQFMGI